MASVGPPGSASSVNPQQDHDPAALPVSWEGDTMFNLYIYDYCSKRGFSKTARELFQEAKLAPDAVPPINARQGLLFEWWTVFWALFNAKSNGAGTDDAMVYTQYQNNQNGPRTGNARLPQVPPRLPQGPGPNSIQRPLQGPMIGPNGMPNGVGGNQPGVGPGPVGAGAQGPMFNGPPSGMQQVNGMPIPSAAGGGGGGSGNGPPGAGPPGGPAPNFANIMPGQRPVPPRGLPGAAGVGGSGPPYHSPTMANSPQTAGTPGHHQAGGPMGGLGQSPHMQPMTRPGGMMPPGAPAQTPPFSQLGHSPSRPGTPGGAGVGMGGQQGGGMMHPSPLMANRPIQMTEEMLTNEIGRFPPQELAVCKAELGMGGRQDLNFEEKQRLYMKIKQRATMRMSKSGMPGPAGPSNPNQPMQPVGPHMQGQNPQQGLRPPQPGHQPQQGPMGGQLQAQQQRGGKRSSTSPGEEHNGLNADGSPPANKRVRRNSGEHQQPGQPGQPGQHGGPPGPQGPHQMPNAMMRGPGPGPGPGPMGGGGQPMNFNGPGPQGGPPGQGMVMGMGQPGMGSVSPAMHNPRIMPGQGGPQTQPQAYPYHAQMAHAHKGPMQGMMGNRPPNSAPADMAQFNGVGMVGGVGVGMGGQQMFAPGGGPQNPRVAANKGMGGMMPPPSPHMGGPPGKDGTKDGKPGGPGGPGNVGVGGPQGGPEGSPRNPPMPGQGPPGGPGGQQQPPPGQQGPPGQQQQSGQAGQGGPQSGTAPPTPSATASSMTNPSPSPAMTHNNVQQGGGPGGVGGGPGGPGPQPGAQQNGQQQGPGPGQQAQQQQQQQQQQVAAAAAAMDLPANLFDANFMNQVANSLDNFTDTFMQPEGQIDFERDFADWFSVPGATDMSS